MRLPEDASIDAVHDEERRADHAGVFAHQARRWHGHTGVPQRSHHSIFTIDGVRRRQQLARRLLPEHIGRAGRLQDKSGIGLATFELSNLEGALKTFERRGQITLERVTIELVTAPDRGGVADDRCARHARACSVARAEGDNGFVLRTRFLQEADAIARESGATVEGILSLTIERSATELSSGATDAIL